MTVQELIDKLSALPAPMKDWKITRCDDGTEEDIEDFLLPEEAYPLIYSKNWWDKSYNDSQRKNWHPDRIIIR